MTHEQPRGYHRYRALKLSGAGGVMTITISNPARKNALTPRLLRELDTIWDDVGADPDVRIIVLTGDGNDFCAGVDISQVESLHDARDEEEEGRGGRPGRGGVYAVIDCQKPTLAKVRGVAYGLGANLALACDMVFVSEGARIADSHVKAGLVAGDGGVMLWPLLVGMHRAKECLMTGEPVSGRRAEEIGLVNRCLADADLDREVEAMAQRLLALPPFALNRTKIALNKAMEHMAGPAFDLSLAWEMQCFNTEDFHEATRAFLEKRKGVYTGR